MLRFLAHRLLFPAIALAVLALLLLLWRFNWTIVQSDSDSTGTEEKVIQRRLAEAEVIWERGVKRREQAAKQTVFPADNPYSSVYLRLIWDFFYPEFNCPHNLERLGRVGDGGKWICGINQLVKKGNKCVVYSYGLSTETSFEENILQRTNCYLYGYDHTVDSANNSLAKFYPERVTVSKIGLGVSNAGILRTLKTEMDARGHKFIDVLKLDVEGYEKGALTQIIQDFPNGLPFGQLIIEIHMLAFFQTNLFGDFKYWWDELERAGLRAYHSEPNMYNQMGDKQRSTALYEYSFLNVKTDHSVLHA